VVSEKPVDLSNCLIAHIRDRTGSGHGPLRGVKYVVKDLFDVAGVPTTAGNPDFARYRGIPSIDAWAVSTLDEAGAELIGKTNLHELAYGITGINPHFGTPKNPRDPARIPGGSSSGSAVAVGAGLVPFALGTDTGGSVRVPASFCGIWGFRPTHGYIPSDGVVPLAPSFDTVGIFARSGELLKIVAQLLLRPPVERPVKKLDRALVVRDALDYADLEGRVAVARVRDALRELGMPTEDVEVGVLDACYGSQRVVQAAEAWGTHQDWITRHRPRLGADVAQLFQRAAQLEAGEIGRASGARSALMRKVEAMLEDRSVLIMPVAPGVAPKLSLFDTPEASVKARERILRLTNLASLCGLPVVVIPTAKEDELPVGGALVGPAGADLQLIELAQKVADHLNQR